MRYAFYSTTTANPRCFFMKSEGTHTGILLCFSDFISFGPKLWVYNFTYLALYSLQAALMLQMFGLRYIYLFSTELKKYLFIKTPRVALLLLY